ncbi:hypothetical protein [Pleionea sediminis]|uniref:hypothetical protein n=1 Tax=Pleionea sediminis TaxID=2569479 RepID=UPI001186A224|nr:hypothetical protein [Pleionea sediminis]
MNKSIVWLVLLQTLVIFCLLIFISNLDNKINQLTRELTSPVKASYTRVDNDGLNPTKTLPPVTIRQVCSEETLKQLTRQLEKYFTSHPIESTNELESKTQQDPLEYSNTYSQVAAKIDHFISLGSISNEDFMLLSQEASTLPRTQRDSLLKKLARELNRR